MAILHGKVPAPRVRVVARFEQADPDYSLSRRVTVFGNSKYKSLNRAEKDIQEYIDRLEDDPAASEAFEKAKKTLATLQAQHQAAIDMEQEHPENARQADEQLTRLDGMTRELSSACSGMKLMVDALHHLQRKQSLAGDVASPEVTQSVDDELHIQQQREQRLRNIFDQLDHNGDGRLDISEFRAAMDVLNDHLDGAMVSEICQVLDIHGLVTFDQFCDIVEAEAVRARTDEAGRLRAMLHASSDDSYKSWLMSLSGHNE